MGDMQISCSTYLRLVDHILSNSVKRGHVRIFVGEVELSQYRYRVLFQVSCWVVIGEKANATINYAMASAFTENGFSIDTDFNEQEFTEYLIKKALKA